VIRGGVGSASKPSSGKTGLFLHLHRIRFHPVTSGIKRDTPLTKMPAPWAGYIFFGSLIISSWCISILWFIQSIFQGNYMGGNS